MHRTHCHELPAELWSVILSAVDDLTLWTSCRRVCRIFRAEAEREFAEERLQNLYIKWEALSARQYKSQSTFYFMLASTVGLKSIDGHRATFGLHMETDQPTTLDCENRVEAEIETYEKPGLYGAAYIYLSNSDRNINARLDVDPRLSSGPGMAQICRLGSYVADAPMPNLDLPVTIFDALPISRRMTTSVTISFDWKEFLDGFLGVFAHCQVLAREQRCNDLDADVIEERVRESFRDCETVSKPQIDAWMEKYISTEARMCFQKAYIARVRRFHQRRGYLLELDLGGVGHVSNDTARKKLDDYVKVMIEKRVRCILRSVNRRCSQPQS